MGGGGSCVHKAKLHSTQPLQYFSQVTTLLFISRLSQLSAITPLDGRYKSRVAELSDYFSECSYMKYRCQTEIEYVSWWGACPHASSRPRTTESNGQRFRSLPSGGALFYRGRMCNLKNVSVYSCTTVFVFECLFVPTSPTFLLPTLLFV